MRANACQFTMMYRGKIRNTKYEKDGQTVYGTDFIADKVDYLDTKAPGGSNQE